jgi:hypothetical protein
MAQSPPGKRSGQETPEARQVDAFALLQAEGQAVTLDRYYRPRALMTRTQAVAILAIAADKPKGTIPEEFLAEAQEVLRSRSNGVE